MSGAHPGPLTSLRPAAERGRLEIHPAVLRKIVEHAADQVPGTLRHERRLAGIDVGEVGAVAKVVTGVGGASTVDVAAGADPAVPGRGPFGDRRGARAGRGGAGPGSPGTGCAR